MPVHVELLELVVEERKRLKGRRMLISYDICGCLAAPQTKFCAAFLAPWFSVAYTMWGWGGASFER